jgi:hypothetical protein
VFAALADECHLSCSATPCRQGSPSYYASKLLDVPCPVQREPSVVELYPLRRFDASKKY